MNIIQTLSAFYIVALFVVVSIRILASLWDDEDPSVRINAPASILLFFATLVCAITTLGAV